MKTENRNKRVNAIEDALKNHGELNLSIFGKGRFTLAPEECLDLSVFNNEPVQIPLVVFHAMAKGYIPDNLKTTTNTINELSTGVTFIADYESFDGKEIHFKIRLLPSDISH